MPTSVIAAQVDRGLVDIETQLADPENGVVGTDGTGMILDPSGLVLTNNHVILGASTISAVTVVDGRRYPATVVGVAPESDVALLQLQGASGLPTVSIQGFSPLPGDSVVTLGNALGAGGAPSVTTGTLVSLDASITADDSLRGPETLGGLIETTAPLQPGDSGGPLVDTSGKVIGMDTVGYQNGPAIIYSYAIEISNALDKVDQMKHGQATGGVYLGLPAYLGVNVNKGPTAGITANPGVPVTNLAPGSPAARVGIGLGDTIMMIDSTAIGPDAPLPLAMRIYHPGATVTVGWNDQQGNSHSASVTLGTGPAD